jgi:hypothetical protein
MASSLGTEKEKRICNLWQLRGSSISLIHLTSSCLLSGATWGSQKWARSGGEAAILSW